MKHAIHVTPTYTFSLVGMMNRIIRASLQHVRSISVVWRFSGRFQITHFLPYSYFRSCPYAVESRYHVQFTRGIIDSD
jgi:hypothetical protein